MFPNCAGLAAQVNPGRLIWCDLSSSSAIIPMRRKGTPGQPRLGCGWETITRRLKRRLIILISAGWLPPLKYRRGAASL